MILTIKCTSNNWSIPETAPHEYIHCDGKHLVISGHRTGRRNMFVIVCPDAITVSDDYQSLCTAIVRLGGLSVNPDSLAHLLRNALCPTPMTALINVYSLTFGDTLTIRTLLDGAPVVTNEYAFPYLSALSRNDSVPSTDTLFHLLCEAVDEHLGSTSEGVLMLSSGKDSTSILLALAELGRKNIRALTYVAGTANDEDDYAKPLAKRFGIPHMTVRLDNDPRYMNNLLIHYFENTPFPGLDKTQIPYLLSLDAGGVSNEIVLDASGNDLYMGHVLGKYDRVKLFYNVSHFVPKSSINLLSHVSPLTFFFKSRSETCFPGYYFKPSTIELLLGTCDLTQEYWAESDRNNKELDMFDFRIAIRVRHYDSNQVMLKACTAAAARGVAIEFPWTNEKLADYYFNLPEPERFDRNGFVNKILLRRMLRERLEYPDAMLGKRFFEFQLAPFMAAHRKFVIDEIFACNLWQSPVRTLVPRWYDSLSSTPHLAYGLNALFMISGWYNHSKYINR